MFVRNTRYRGPLRGIVFDWAGTLVDHGCLAPIEPFRDAFRRLEIDLAVADIRRFMGLPKLDQIKSILALPGVQETWRAHHGGEPSAKQIEKLRTTLEQGLLAKVAGFAEPIEGVPGFVIAMRGRGLRIGSTTGYSQAVMKPLAAAAKKHGLEVDAVVCPEDVAAGRPAPFMCYLNALRLGIYPFEAMVKIGDSIADVQEGLNAGMWTVALTRTGNELGLSADELKALPEVERQHRLDQIATNFRAAGAHFVVQSVADCLPVIEEIEGRLSRGELPAPRE